VARKQYLRKEFYNMPIIRQIEVLQSPETPCPLCGDVLEDLIGALQQLLDTDRDGFMTALCKGCKGVFKAETKAVRHLDNQKMAPVSRSEREKLTGMKDKNLEKGELPSSAPRPAEQEAIRLAIKAENALKKPKPKPKKTGKSRP
jgi:hypothetical protein